MGQIRSNAMQQQTGSSSKLPKILGLVGGAILAIAAIVLVTGLWLPGWFPKTFSQSAVEDGVKKVLSTDYSIDNVEKVSCPPGQSVSSGKKFSCDVTVGGQAQGDHHHHRQRRQVRGGAPGLMAVGRFL